jgi:hypothetical protein
MVFEKKFRPEIFTSVKIPRTDKEIVHTIGSRLFPNGREQKYASRDGSYRIMCEIPPLWDLRGAETWSFRDSLFIFRNFIK